MRLSEATGRIRALYPWSGFDCRPLMLPDEEPNYADKQSEAFAIGYMGFKYTVARVLAPERICEIGVCTGVAALAFLAACPSAFYLGIDALTEDRYRKTAMVERTGRRLAERGYHHLIRIGDSQAMDGLPDGPFDLIHVDGDHSRAGAAHDVRLAWEALAPGGFILVDDARDSAVAAGTFDALDGLHPGDTAFAYFEDTWRGNLLVSKERLL